MNPVYGANAQKWGRGSQYKVVSTYRKRLSRVPPADLYHRSAHIDYIKTSVYDPTSTYRVRHITPVLRLRAEGSRLRSYFYLPSSSHHTSSPSSSRGLTPTILLLPTEFVTSHQLSVFSSSSLGPAVPLRPLDGNFPALSSIWPA